MTFDEAVQELTPKLNTFQGIQFEVEMFDSYHPEFGRCLKVAVNDGQVKTPSGEMIIDPVKKTYFVRIPKTIFYLEDLQALGKMAKVVEALELTRMDP